MKREEIGIWAEDCGIGQTDLIVFAFHLPALMEVILIGKSPCRAKQTLSGGKCMHFTSQFQ